MKKKVKALKEIEISSELTYIGVFLTIRCQYSCSYCINYQAKLKIRKELTPSQWIEGLNRLQIERDWIVPITIQGGEPSAYPGYLTVIKNLKKEFYIDMLTNLNFDITEFTDEIPPDRMQRDVPYASIRATYHPDKVNMNEFLGKIYTLQSKGYSIGIFVIEHPEEDFTEIQEKCKRIGLDIRPKEFLGEFEGKLYGTFKYLPNKNPVECKMTELLIAPDGNIHKCHRDLYYSEDSLGNILDKDLRIEFKFRRCKHADQCSWCDTKIKNNRFQKFGTCSAKIKEIS